MTTYKQKTRKKLQLIAQLFALALTFHIVAGAGSIQAQDIADKKTLRPKIETDAAQQSLTTSMIYDNFDNIIVPTSTAGAASIYPSVINVSGLSGTISDINVTLYNINHTSFNNLDVMLVAPDGTNLVFLSDVDYTPSGVTNLSLGFDDSAATRIPLFSAPSGVVFKPSAYVDPGEGADTFAAPAPAPSGASELNVFNGHNPNGAWRLYVMDDTAGAGGNIASGWRIEITTAPANRASKVLDFDGDGRTDYVMARNVSGSLQWYVLQSTAGFRAVSFGINGDTFVPADYDGDGKTDIAVWGVRGSSTNASYYILRSSDNTFQAISWGITNDDPRYAEDFDGDGRADPTVVRSQGGTFYWYTLLSATNNYRATPFGGAGFTDLPMRGDYDGDGRADLAVYRLGGSSPNVFLVLQSSSNTLKSTPFGRGSTDFILPADFDGDGVTDYAVWRGIQTGGDSGAWYWLNSRNGSLGSLPFGIGSATFPQPDWAVPGDYDGDGRTDQAVWRRDNGTFYVNGSATGFSSVQFGISTDRIVPYELQVR